MRFIKKIQKSGISWTMKNEKKLFKHFVKMGKFPKQISTSGKLTYN
jgi:hypothetical protein